MNPGRIAAIARCELRQLWRDPMLVLRAVGVPVTLLVLFGYGLSLDVERIPLAVVDHDRSATSREYIAAFASTRTFELRSAAASEDAVEAMLRRGEIRLVIIIPGQLERRLYHGLPVTVQLLVDGGFPYRAEVTRGYALAAHARVATRVLAARLRERTGRGLDLAPIEIRTRYLYNETLRTTNTIVPGLLAVILMMSPAVMMALAVVREKELGSIFNFMSSPVTRSEFVVGKLLPYVAIGIGNAVLLAGLAVGLFGVPFKGSVALYLGGSALYVIATSAIGLVISAFVRTQIAGIAVTSILTMVPVLHYSGLFLPVQSMSGEARLTAHLFPAMYHHRIVMAAYLKDLPARVVLVDLGTLALFVVVLLAAGVVLVRKRET